MKNSVVLLISCLFTLCAACQNKRIDSLKAEIEKHPAFDSTRFQLLSSASFAFLYAGKPAEARAYNNLSREVAQRLNMPWMKGTALRMDGILAFDQGNYDEALKFYHTAEKLLQADIAKTGREISKLKLAAVYTELRITYILKEKYPEAISYAHKSIDLGMQQKVYKVVFPSMIELGLVYKRTGNYSEAIAAYNDAFRILQLWENEDSRNVDTYNKARIYVNLAEAYFLQKDYAGSVGYFEKVKPELEKDSTNNSPAAIRLRAAAYANAAFAYKETGDWDKALECIDISTVIAVKLNKSLAAINELQRWEIYTEAPDAMLVKKVADLPQKYEQAIASFERIRSGVNKEITFEVRMQLLTTLSRMYEKIGQYSKSLAVFKEYVALKDSTMGSEQQKELMRKDVEFAFSKREDSIKLQQQITQSQLRQQSLLATQRQQALQLSTKEKDLQRLAYLSSRAELERKNAQNEKEVLYQEGLVSQNRLQAQVKDKQIQAQNISIKYNKNMNIILVAGVGLLLLITGFIFYSQRRTARLNKIVSKQNAVLEHQKAELSAQGLKLTTMMKELNHRVKNNLQVVSSLLNLQSYRLNDKEAIAALTESKQRVQAMSLLHQRLYKTDDITRINIKDYITELASFLASSYGYNEERLDLFLHVNEEWLDIDKAIPLGLIVNELVTNAFKYAYDEINRPSLEINLIDTGNAMSLSVTDNGKGVSPEKWNEEHSSSFGRQLIKALCTQLNATEKLVVNNGSSFIFKIPKAA